MKLLLIIMAPKHLSFVEKVHIMTLREEKVSVLNICECMGRSRRSILRVLAAEKKLTRGEMPKREVGSGRPKKTSEMTDKLIKREVTINPKILQSN